MGPPGETVTPIRIADMPTLLDLTVAAPPPPGDRTILTWNNTRGDVDGVVPRGATGAETSMSDSAAGSPVVRPEPAVRNDNASTR